MTVCVAVMFQHNGYAGIVTASDRMLTAYDIDIQYEHPISKFADLAPGVAVLVAGNMVVHTAVIRATKERIRVKRLTQPVEIAEAYAAELREYSIKKAEQYYLAPVRMTIEALLASDRLETATFQDMYRRVTGYAETDEMNVNAMVVGSTREMTEICAIDKFGRVTLHSDIGFHAIGIGISHASGHLMQASAHNAQSYYQALWQAYCAKRRAHIAPGVGTTTDMLSLFDGTWTRIGIQVLNALAAEWDINEGHRVTNDTAAIGSLEIAFPSKPPPQATQTFAATTAEEAPSDAKEESVANVEEPVSGEDAPGGAESTEKTGKKRAKKSANETGGEGE